MSYVNGFASVVPLPGQMGSTAFAGAPELGGAADAEASAYVTNPDEAMSFAAAAPLRAPFFARKTAGVKGGEGGAADANAKAVEQVTDAIVAGDVGKLTEALSAPASGKMEPNALIKILRQAIDTADRRLNGAKIVENEYRSFLESHWGDGWKISDHGWHVTVEMLQEYPTLSPVFWDVQNAAIQKMYDGEFSFREFVDHRLENSIESAFKGNVCDALIRAFVEHVVNNPKSSCLDWAKEKAKSIIWKPAAKVLTEKLHKGEIDAETLARLVG